MDAGGTTSKKYKNITVCGKVAAERVEVLEIPALVILLLGPTGSGKSTFVEAIAKDPSLRISSGQLEGYTQSISMYRLSNVAYEGDPIYLVDVPGFADTKISEMKIVCMLRDWMIKNKVQAFSCLLYLIPINVARFSGSHMQVLRTFESLTGVKAAPSITIVSTMWDSIWNDRARDRAERNFKQLRDEIVQPFIAHGSPVVRFYNTQSSALSAVDTALDGVTIYDYHLETFVNHSQDLHQTPFANHLHHGLQVRIQNLQSQRDHIQSDMDDASERSDGQLMVILLSNLEVVETYLARFKQEMRDLFSSSYHSSGLSSLDQEDPEYEWDIAQLLLIDCGDASDNLESLTPNPERQIATVSPSVFSSAIHVTNLPQASSLSEPLIQIEAPACLPSTTSPEFHHVASPSSSFDSIDSILPGQSQNATAYKAQTSVNSLDKTERNAEQGRLARVGGIMKWWWPSRWRAL